MNNIPFQVFAWISCIAYAMSVVAAKLVSKYEIKNPWLMNFVYMGFVSLLILPFALANNAALPSHWGNIFWAGVFCALGSVLYVLALFELDLSVLSPMFNIRTAFAVLLGIVFLGEILTGWQLFLILVMFLSGFLVSADEKFSWRSLFSRGGVYALCDMVVLALMAMFIKKAIAEIGFWPATLWMQIISQLFLCLTIPFFIKDLKKKLLPKSFWFYMLFISLFDMIGTVTSNKAYASNVGITAAIISIPFSGIFAVGLSFFVPKLLEKHPLKVYIVRFIGAAMMVYAGIKLS